MSIMYQDHALTTFHLQLGCVSRDCVNVRVMFSLYINERYFYIFPYGCAIVYLYYSFIITVLYSTVVLCRKW